LIGEEEIETVRVVAGYVSLPAVVAGLAHVDLSLVVVLQLYMLLMLWLPLRARAVGRLSSLV
jgi:hypothetical protein